MFKSRCILTLFLFLATVIYGAAAYPGVRRTSTILNSPNFPAPALEERGLPGKRGVGKPICDFTRGLAYIEPTDVNINHLRDAKDTYCGAEAGNCARVSYLNSSSIFFCNYNTNRIYTKCGNLIEPALAIYEDCRLASRYTYGYLSGAELP
ncbi:hypothetical protein BDV37DRAFT_289991 [Aspergillus pseudonomiae]|uniref:Uncharacterized protein n=1 Tax=Aspergillus pseudonomiae TaxID=1506151 RepID=A0A5N7CRF1_9EURO|nr:uncharacterized protein BDV37DRAFT_289991 [Aspergillus pseudonomiae]KAE8396781.1 hypothetical protein BDV37DRAFT_289991 [Aspergillus pseudonomiae]